MTETSSSPSPVGMPTHAAQTQELTAPVESAPTGLPPQPARSLFEPNEALYHGLLPDDMPFTNEVDAALHRKPRRGAVWLSLAVGAFLSCMLLWAAIADIDEVTHAEGQVIASQRTQAIQNLEGGILRSIQVNEGQIVEKGSVLAQLDNEMAASSYRDAMGKALDHALAIIRLEAEISGQTPAWPTDLSLWLARALGQKPDWTPPEDFPVQVQESLQSHKTLFAARMQQKNKELELLESQRLQRAQEVEELKKRLVNQTSSLKIMEEQRNIAAQLHGRGSYSRAELLQSQQHYQQLRTEVDALSLALPRADAAAREAEQRIGYRSAELEAALADEANKRRQELVSLRENLSAGGDRVTRTELRSPVRGTVKRISITTLGGVVKPGESIMEIVPLDDALLVEARVRPADVAFLRPGQQATVKISAYDFSIYGGLNGQLEQISADTLEDRRGETFYLVKVRTQGTAIQYQQKDLPIMPGMVATVDILTGKKSVLDYILKPILKARQKALRER